MFFSLGAQGLRWACVCWTQPSELPGAGPRCCVYNLSTDFFPSLQEIDLISRFCGLLSVAFDIFVLPLDLWKIPSFLDFWDNHSLIFPTFFLVSFGKFSSSTSPSLFFFLKPESYSRPHFILLHITSLGDFHPLAWYQLSSDDGQFSISSPSLSTGLWKCISN